MDAYDVVMLIREQLYYNGIQSNETEDINEGTTIEELVDFINSRGLGEDVFIKIESKYGNE